MSVVRGESTGCSLAAWLEAAAAAGGLQPVEAEIVALDQAAGRVTAEPVTARRSTPGYDGAAMDGVAIAAATTRTAPLALDASESPGVDTGDPLPLGADAVVRWEDVERHGDDVVLPHAVAAWTNVRQVGEDVATGDLLLPAGRALSPADLAVLAAAGHTTVAVRRRPVVAILPTGDELVPPGGEPAHGAIVDTNSLMLAAQVEHAGAQAVRWPILPDDPEQLARALRRAGDEADLVLLLAGSAKGTDDHAVSVVERTGRVVVQGVAVRPGHPVLLGLAGGTPLVGVPGYPVSAALTCDLFVLPAIAALTGTSAPQRTRTHATAGVGFGSSHRSDEWVRLRLGRIGDHLLALPLRRGAGVLSSLARADGLACVPIGTEEVVAGTEVEVELLRPLAEIERMLLLAGSTDPLADALAATGLVVADCAGSVAGAAALDRGRCHLALLASEDVPADGVSLLRQTRELGLAVAPGNPLGITGVASLAGAARLANRPAGSAARRLLDRLLLEHGIEPAAVNGYLREARSLAAAAAAVAAGAVDCAVAPRAVADRYGLELVPLAPEELVLVTRPEFASDPRIARLREMDLIDFWSRSSVR